MKEDNKGCLLALIIPTSIWLAYLLHCTGSRQLILIFNPPGVISHLGRSLSIMTKGEWPNSQNLWGELDTLPQHWQQFDPDMLMKCFVIKPKYAFKAHDTGQNNMNTIQYNHRDFCWYGKKTDWKTAIISCLRGSWCWRNVCIIFLIRKSTSIQNSLKILHKAHNYC